MEIRLDSLTPEAEAVVTGFFCSEALRRRLADFGMVEGTHVTCRYRSPRQDVFALELRGTTLALRRTDLAQIVGHRV